MSMPLNKSRRTRTSGLMLKPRLRCCCIPSQRPPNAVLPWTVPKWSDGRSKPWLPFCRCGRPCPGTSLVMNPPDAEPALHSLAQRRTDGRMILARGDAGSAGHCASERFTGKSCLRGRASHRRRCSGAYGPIHCATTCAAMSLTSDRASSACGAAHTHTRRGGDWQRNAEEIVRRAKQ